MNSRLRIGELAALGTAPFYHPLKNIEPDPAWRFQAGTALSLGRQLADGELDVALVSPLALASSPGDFLVFPDLGYGGRGHMRDMLLFSDLYLDDMDELTVSLPEESPTVSALVRVVLDRYLQYQNQYLMGWGNAEAFVLDGDSALRERALARYAYVYDVGDLWRHYTGQALAYYVWAARLDAVEKDAEAVIDFSRRLAWALSFAKSNWDRLAGQARGYEWLRKNMVRKLWDQVDFVLTDDHFTGLGRFFEDCQTIGLIEDAPELEFLETDSVD